MSHPSDHIRVLLLADSHLGYDLPLRPRVRRRRRGLDFQANHDVVLGAVHSLGVDLVVHGGDLFHRPRVPPSLAYQAFRGLLEVADSGVPVFVVPGNHERSRIPHLHLAAHPNLHVFQRPETFLATVRERQVAMAGFPFHRRGVRAAFPGILTKTGWEGQEADLRLLCLHHCVEGARVGPVNHVFRKAPDVIRCADLPQGFAAVLSGHIHRHQVLRKDLQGHALPAPVYYPGSVERTAFAEMGEEKGYLILEFRAGAGGGIAVRHAFKPLPSRPMRILDLYPEDRKTNAGMGKGSWQAEALACRLSRAVATVPRNAVLRLRVHGSVSRQTRVLLSAPGLRGISPPEMNLEAVIMEESERRTGRRHAGPREGKSRKKAGCGELELGI